MAKGLEVVTRELSQRLVASTTLLIAVDAPSDVTPFNRGTQATWWTNIDGLVKVINDPIERERFVSINAEDTTKIPRPLSLLVFTADAHTKFLEAVESSSDLEASSLAPITQRVAVLAPLSELVTSADGFEELSLPGLRVEGVASIHSRTDQDTEFLLAKVSDPLTDPSLAIEEKQELLRERNYLNSLLSRILRMQYEVDNFRLLAEKALAAERKALAELQEIKRSPRYRLALMGVHPIDAMRKGRSKLRADESKPAGNKAIGS